MREEFRESAICEQNREGVRKERKNTLGQKERKKERKRKEKEMNNVLFRLFCKEKKDQKGSCCCLLSNFSKKKLFLQDDSKASWAADVYFFKLIVDDCDETSLFYQNA